MCQVSCRAAALRSQDTELTELKAGLLEAEKLATDAEARLQPLSESLELCKHKYQACLSKIAQLENTLFGREEDLKEAHSQVGTYISISYLKKLNLLCSCRSALYTGFDCISYNFNPYSFHFPTEYPFLLYCVNMLTKNIDHVFNNQP